MGVISELIVKVGSDIRDLKSGMKEAEESQTLAQMGTNKLRAGFEIAGIAAVAAGTAIAGFAVASERHAEEAGQAAWELAEKYGFTKQYASELLAVGQQLGVSTETLAATFGIFSKNLELLNLKGAAADTKAIEKASDALEKQTSATAKAHQHLGDVEAELAGKRKLTTAEAIRLRDAHAAVVEADKRLAEAHDKLAAAQKGVDLTSAPVALALKSIGVATTDSNGKLRDMKDILGDVADRFKAMPDGPEKTGIAMQLFGRQGKDVIEILNEGRDGIDAYIEKAGQMGAVMSGPTVDSAHQAYLAHKEFDTAMGGLMNTIGIGLMPVMTNLVKFLSEQVIPGVRTIVGWFQNWNETSKALQPWLPLIGGGIAFIGGILAAVLIPAFIAWVAATWANVVAHIALGVAMLMAYWPILLIIAAIALLVVGVILLVQHWDWVKAKATEVWNWVKEKAGQAAQWVTDRWNDLINWFKALPGRISAIAAGMWDGIKNAFRAAINWIIGKWNALHFTIGGGSFLGQNIPSTTLWVPQIPYLQKGTDFVPQDTLAYLHRGEAVVPASQNRAREVRLVIEGGVVFLDGPAMDDFLNTAARRLSIALGT